MSSSFHLMMNENQINHYRRDYGKSRLWRSCKTPHWCGGRRSKNPAPLGAGSSNSDT